MALWGSGVQIPSAPPAFYKGAFAEDHSTNLCFSVCGNKELAA